MDLGGDSRKGVAIIGALQEKLGESVYISALFEAPTVAALARHLGHADTLAYHPWPTVDESLLVSDTVELPVQVLGKSRGTITIPTDADEAAAVAAASALPTVAAQLEGKTIRKVIYKPGQILNLIVG